LDVVVKNQPILFKKIKKEVLGEKTMDHSIIQTKHTHLVMCWWAPTPKLDVELLVLPQTLTCPSIVLKNN
jgi:hypothetical protein